MGPLFMVVGTYEVVLFLFNKFFLLCTCCVCPRGWWSLDDITIYWMMSLNWMDKVWNRLSQWRDHILSVSIHLPLHWLSHFEDISISVRLIIQQTDIKTHPSFSAFLDIHKNAVMIVPYASDPCYILLILDHLPRSFKYFLSNVGTE